MSEIIVGLKVQRSSETKGTVNLSLNKDTPHMTDRPPRIQKSFDKALPRVFVDLKQIRQVLIPIIKNAMEVIPDGGVFFIKTRVDNGFARYIIIDTGAQMPQSDLIRLYYSFVNGRPRRFGLGLAIIRRIVEANKGTFSIANKEKME